MKWSICVTTKNNKVIYYYALYVQMLNSQLWLQLFLLISYSQFTWFISLWPLKYPVQVESSSWSSGKATRSQKTHGSLSKILNAPYSYTSSDKTWRQLCFRPTTAWFRDFKCPYCLLPSPKGQATYEASEMGRTHEPDLQAEGPQYLFVMRSTWTGPPKNFNLH